MISPCVWEKQYRAFHSNIMSLAIVYRYAYPRCLGIFVHFQWHWQLNVAAVVQENVPFTESEDNYATAMTLTMVYSETCKYSLFLLLLLLLLSIKIFMILIHIYFWLLS